MASQRSEHSQASTSSNESVQQVHSQPLSTRAASFLQHKYHQLHLTSKPNNHGVVLQHSGYPAETKPLISILQNHYLNPALTLLREDIPETYLSQFWLSAAVEVISGHGECITGYATHANAKDIALLSINKVKLRTILGLPSKNDLNLAQYTGNPTDYEICRFLEFLGYNEPLAKRSEFRRGRLPLLEYSFFHS